MEETVVKEQEREVEAAIPQLELARDHNRLLRLEGAADVNAELAEIGLSNKSGWYASIVLYGVGGILAILAWQLRPEAVPAGVGYLGIFALVLSALSMVGSRFLTNDDWATHLRLSLGLLIFLIGAFVADDVRVAFTMLPMFVLLTPTFLYGARFAIPYMAAVTPTMFVCVLLTPGPAPFAQAVITSGAMLVITSSFLVAENRTRSLARINREMAFTDPLTGIANTRRLRERLTRALGENERFALFAIDLDNFKEVNDRFDHTTGDRVLKAVAASLANELGEGDFVARRGGDEFSVLIANPEVVELERVTARLARAIERARLATCPEVSPSGSVAYVLSEHSDSISSVLQRADDALHEAKLAFRAGRSSVRDLGDAEPIEGTERKVEREQVLRSVSAAVSRAYSSSEHSRSIEPAKDLFERVWGIVRSGDALWTYVAGVLFPIGLVYGLLGAFGGFAPFSRIGGVAMGLAFIAFGAVAFAAARERVPHSWLLFVQLGAIAVLSVGIYFAGTVGAAMLDTYVVFALIGFYGLRPRFASIGLFVSCALYLAFSFFGDYPVAGIRAAVTVSVMLVAALIVVRVSSVTAGFVRANRELSEVDALTGTANLRALKMRVRNVISAGESKTGARPILMTIDLDRFKLVNDHYNHTVGDQMLEAVARAIAECVRIDEMVARRGGDEFFVLFNNSTPEHVESVIPRVQAAVAHARTRICPDLTPTASVGCVVHEPGWDADKFLAEADSIMHDEKIETRARDYQPTAP